jgi:hypothetical protein
MEAGDYHYPMLLILKEYSVGKTPDSRTAKTTVDEWELQRMFSNYSNRGLDLQRETFSKPWANIVIPRPASSKSSFASGIQTTRRITVS